MADAALILAVGDLPSLVALGAALSQLRPAQVRLLHLKDTRVNARSRRRTALEQAKHYDVRPPIELQMPALGSSAQAEHRGVPPEQAHAALLDAQILLVGLAQAIELRVSQLIWPVQVDADFDRCAAVTEQVQLVDELAQLDHDQVPQIETPLVELDDQQVVELGAHLDVPWRLAWTCLLHGETPCRVCPACRQRHAAFDAAGIVDPVDEPVGVGTRDER